MAKIWSNQGIPHGFGLDILNPVPIDRRSVQDEVDMPIALSSVLHEGQIVSVDIGGNEYEIVKVNKDMTTSPLGGGGVTAPPSENNLTPAIKISWADYQVLEQANEIDPYTIYVIDGDPADLGFVPPDAATEAWVKQNDQTGILAVSPSDSASFLQSILNFAPDNQSKRSVYWTNSQIMSMTDKPPGTSHLIVTIERGVVNAKVTAIDVQSVAPKTYERYIIGLNTIPQWDAVSSGWREVGSGMGGDNASSIEFEPIPSIGIHSTNVQDAIYDVGERVYNNTVPLVLTMTTSDECFIENSAMDLQESLGMPVTKPDTLNDYKMVFMNVFNMVDDYTDFDLHCVVYFDRFANAANMVLDFLDTIEPGIKDMYLDALYELTMWCTNNGPFDISGSTGDPIIDSCIEIFAAVYQFFMLGIEDKMARASIISYRMGDGSVDLEWEFTPILICISKGLTNLFIVSPGKIGL